MGGMNGVVYGAETTAVEYGVPSTKSRRVVVGTIVRSSSDGNTETRHNMVQTIFSKFAFFCTVLLFTAILSYQWYLADVTIQIKHNTGISILSLQPLPTLP